MDAPGHDRIDGQAGFQTVCGAELAILDLTAALEDAAWFTRARRAGLTAAGKPARAPCRGVVFGNRAFVPVERKALYRPVGQPYG